MFQKGGRVGDITIRRSGLTDKAVFVKVDHKKRVGTIYGPFTRESDPQIPRSKTRAPQRIKTCIYAEDLEDVPVCIMASDVDTVFAG